MAQGFKIADQMGGRIGVARARRQAFARAALIDEDDEMAIGVKKRALPGVAAAARTAMQKDHRNAPGISEKRNMQAVPLACVKEKAAL